MTGLSKVRITSYCETMRFAYQRAQVIVFASNIYDLHPVICLCTGIHMQLPVCWLSQEEAAFYRKAHEGWVACVKVFVHLRWLVPLDWLQLWTLNSESWQIHHVHYNTVCLCTIECIGRLPYKSSKQMYICVHYHLDPVQVTCGKWRPNPESVAAQSVIRYTFQRVDLVGLGLFARSFSMFINSKSQASQGTHGSRIDFTCSHGLT